MRVFFFVILIFVTLISCSNRKQTTQSEPTKEIIDNKDFLVSKDTLVDEDTLNVEGWADEALMSEVNMALEIKNAMEYMDTLERLKDKEIIFSTSDLITSTKISVTEEKKVLNLTDTISSGGFETYIILPPYTDKDVVIKCVEADENNIYTLCTYVAGEEIDYLFISPFHADPSLDPCEKKYFEIYKDYTIKIYTEEANEGEITRKINYYKIDDKGSFERLLF